MNRPQQGGALLTLLVTVASTTQCAGPVTKAHRQDGSGATVVARPLPAPAVQGVAEGTLAPFEFEGADLRTAVISHPAPKVWLSFPDPHMRGGAPVTERGAPALRVDLPPEAKRLLQRHWEHRLALEYDWEHADPSDVEARRLLFVRMGQISQETSLQLRNVFIDAPDGKRHISSDEADDLSRFVNLKIAEVIEQTKVSRELK